MGFIVDKLLKWFNFIYDSRAKKINCGGGERGVSNTTLCLIEVVMNKDE